METRMLTTERLASRGGAPRSGGGRSGRFAAPVDALVLDVFGLERPSRCGHVGRDTISIADGGGPRWHRPAFSGRLLAFR